MKKENKKNFKLANSVLGGGAYKTKKAFTLIELLAIIVILAIIAVITVPIILNVIENARVGSIKDSAYGYKDAINKYYVTKLSEDYSFRLDGTYDINENGKLSDGTTSHDILFSGTTPTGGTLTYEDNILKSGCITFDEYKVTVSNGEMETVEKGTCEETPQVTYKCIRATELHTEECTQTTTSGYCSAAGYTTTGSKGTSTITYGNLGTPGADPVSGDAFDCDVNGDGEYNPETERFYYVSDLYDSTIEGEDKFNHEVAVLIYYNNTVNGEANNTTAVAYDPTPSTDEYGNTIFENWHGPLTASTHMPTTEQWSNINLSSTNRAILYETGEATTSNGTNALPDESNPFSYTKDGIPLAARLLTTQEVESACGITVGSYKLGELDTCNYLLENTTYSNSSLGTLGYWLETPSATYSGSAWIVFGNVRYVSSLNVSDAVYYGSRPAIEILKSEIQS